MIINTILNVITYLFISNTSFTTFKFENPIDLVSIENSSKFKVDISNDKKVLIITPHKTSFNVNMVVVTSKRDYHFKLKGGVVDNSLYVVKRTKGDSAYTFIKKINGFEIYRGATTYKIRNLRAKPFILNGAKLYENEGLLPLHSRVVVNNREIL